jgi:hypothetical protein
VQPLVVALIGTALRLQEISIGVQLRGEQVGDLKNARALAEILTDAFFLGEALGHGCSSFTKAKQSWVSILPGKSLLPACCESVPAPA